jgi:hypothetical protein
MQYTAAKRTCEMDIMPQTTGHFLKKDRKSERTDSDIEETLNQWFFTVTVQDVYVSGPVLKSMSEEPAKMLGHNDFKATDG